MPDNPYLRAASNALAGNTVTGLAAATGQGIGDYLESNDLKSAWETFKEGLLEQEAANAKVPASAQFAANTVSNFLPASRALKGIDAAKRLVEGGGIGPGFTGKMDVSMGQKKFPGKDKALSKFASKNKATPSYSDDDLTGFRELPIKELPNNTKLVLSGSEFKNGKFKSGDAEIKNAEGQTLSTIKLGTDKDGTVVIHSHFPNEKYLGGSSEAKALSKGTGGPARQALAELFGGLGSDPRGMNSGAGLKSYQKDSNALRTLPEQDDKKPRLTTMEGNYLGGDRARFFTPGSSKQRKEFEIATEAVHGTKELPKTRQWLDSVLPSEKTTQEKAQRNVAPMNGASSLASLSAQKAGIFADPTMQPHELAAQRDRFRNQALISVGHPETNNLWESGNSASSRVHAAREKMGLERQGRTDALYGPQEGPARAAQNISQANLRRERENAGLDYGQDWESFLRSLKP